MSKVFQTETRELIQRNVVSCLNSVNLMNARTANSPRAVGDAVQEYLEANFVGCIPAGIVRDFSASFARRSMADVAFTDIDGRYYVIDCKTHNLGPSFNMPNLTSVERLARFYKDANNYFSVLPVSYDVSGMNLEFRDCTFVPIELIDWSCRTLGALGWGRFSLPIPTTSASMSRTRRKHGCCSCATGWTYSIRMKSPRFRKESTSLDTCGHSSRANPIEASSW